MVHKLLQIYTANHSTFPIQILKITVQICGNFLVTQYFDLRYRNAFFGAISFLKPIITNPYIFFLFKEDTIVGFEGHDLSRLYLGILYKIQSTNCVHM